MTGCVLIVDDEINVLKSLRRALRNEPYTVVTAQSAEEGLALLEEKGCNVVLSDEKMPGMAGTAFLAQVKERFPETVRMMLTGHATLDAAMHAVNEGEIYRFFAKPWDDVSLKFGIRSALEKHTLEARTKALLKAMPDSMLRFRRDGACLDYHPTSSSPSTFSREDFVGKTAGEALPPELAEIAQQRMQMVFATGELQFVDFSLAGTCGVRHYEARMVPCGPEEVLMLVRDITDRTEARQALQRLNETLEVRVREEVAKNREKDRVLAHQARQAAMGEMVGAIAHQWRQPLTAASSLVQNIKAFWDAGMLTGESLAATVEAAQRQILFMSDTIDELRTFFRPEKDKELFQLAEITEQALRIAAPQLERLGIAVDFTPPPEACTVHGFPNEAKQVLVNLLNNACQAIEERLSGAETGEPGRIGIRVENEGGVIRTIISDNGCGIPRELRERIFEPYFTTRPDRGGTGVGLYMSRMIIESSMGGRLYLGEERGATTFVVELSGGGA